FSKRRIENKWPAPNRQVAETVVKIERRRGVVKVIGHIDESDRSHAVSRISHRTRLGLEVLGAGLALGALGDALLRAAPYGLNVLIWTVALVAAVFLLGRWRQVALNGRDCWLALPMILMAAAFAWRDSPTLKTLDALALVVALSVATLRAQTGRIRLNGVTEYALGVINTGFNALFGPMFLLFGDVRWQEIPRNGWTKHAPAVWRGVALAAPLILLFGSLFAAADAAFANIVVNAFKFDFGGLMGHLLLAICCSWLVSGYLRGLLLGKEMAITAGRRHGWMSLGIAE